MRTDIEGASGKQLYWLNQYHELPCPNCGHKFSISASRASGILTRLWAKPKRPFARNTL